MLVIRRRAGQAILIGEDIEVEILDAGPCQVKLGITGPRSVHVVRKEVKLTVENNLSAALLSVEMKDLIVNKIVESAQASGISSDKYSKSRYLGHPKQTENPDPA